MNREPCGKCLNCRNGFKWMCLRNRSKRSRKAAPASRSENRCNDCGEPIPPRKRVCAKCRARRRKAYNRRYNRKRQNAEVEATRVKAF